MTLSTGDATLCHREALNTPTPPAWSLHCLRSHAPRANTLPALVRAQVSVGCLPPAAFAGGCVEASVCAWLNVCEGSLPPRLEQHTWGWVSHDLPPLLIRHQASCIRQRPCPSRGVCPTHLPHNSEHSSACPPPTTHLMCGQGQFISGLWNYQPSPSPPTHLHYLSPHAHMGTQQTGER